MSDVRQEGVGREGTGREGAAEPTFEEAYGDLEATVAKLEEGGVALEELLDLFERGMRLVRLCNARLDAAELRVTQLIARADGEPDREPFEG